MPVIRFKNSHLPEGNSPSGYLESIHTGTAKDQCNDEDTGGHSIGYRCRWNTN